MGEITGKIIAALDPVSGTSRAGKAWNKREYVLETQETYPKKVFFNFFGERADQYPLNVGDMVKLSYDIESREYNGRWYTDIRGWKAEPADGSAPAAPAAPAPAMPQGYAPANIAPDPAGAPGSDDNLPF